jgi:hypothetical protein
VYAPKQCRDSATDDSDVDNDSDEDYSADTDLASSGNGSVPSTSQTGDDDETSENNVESSNLSSSPTTSSTDSAASASASRHASDSLVLPDGWDSSRDSKVYRVPLIIVASLLLAVGITVAVVFAVMWRQKRQMARKRARAVDVEKKVKDGEGSSGEESDGGNGAGGASDRRRRRRERVGARGLGDANASASVVSLVSAGEAEKEVHAKKWARAVKHWKARARWTWNQKKKGSRRGRRERTDEAERQEVGGLDNGGGRRDISGETAGSSSSVSVRVGSEENLGGSSTSTSSSETGLRNRPHAHASGRVDDERTTNTTSSHPTSAPTSSSFPSPASTSQTSFSPRPSSPPSNANALSSSSSVPYPYPGPITTTTTDTIPTDVPAYSPRSVPMPLSPPLRMSLVPIPHLTRADLEVDISADDACPPAYRSSRAQTQIRPRTQRNRSSRRRTTGAASGSGTSAGVDRDEMAVRREERRREKAVYVGNPEDYVDCSEDEGRLAEATSVEGDLDRLQQRQRRRRIGVSFDSSYASASEAEDEYNSSSEEERRRRAHLHVATDDKRALERLAEGASAPPAALTSSESDPSQDSGMRGFVGMSTAPEPEVLLGLALGDEDNGGFDESERSGPSRSADNVQTRSMRTSAFPDPPPLSTVTDLEEEYGSPPISHFPPPPPPFCSSIFASTSSPSSPTLPSLSEKGKDSGAIEKLRPSAPPCEFDLVAGEGTSCSSSTSITHPRYTDVNLGLDAPSAPPLDLALGYEHSHAYELALSDDERVRSSASAPPLDLTSSEEDEGCDRRGSGGCDLGRRLERREEGVNGEDAVVGAVR